MDDEDEKMIRDLEVLLEGPFSAPAIRAKRSPALDGIAALRYTGPRVRLEPSSFSRAVLRLRPFYSLLTFQNISCTDDFFCEEISYRPTPGGRCPIFINCPTYPCKVTNTCIQEWVLPHPGADCKKYLCRYRPTPLPWSLGHVKTVTLISVSVTLIFAVVVIIVLHNTYYANRRRRLINLNPNGACAQCRLRNEADNSSSILSQTPSSLNDLPRSLEDWANQPAANDFMQPVDLEPQHEDNRSTAPLTLPDGAAGGTDVSRTVKERFKKLWKKKDSVLERVA